MHVAVIVHLHRAVALTRGGLLVVGVLFAARIVAAEPITFSSRSAFGAAAGPHHLITFEEFAVGPISGCLPISPSIPDPCELTINGMTTFVSTVGGAHQRPLLSIDPSLGSAPSNQLVSNMTPNAGDEFYADLSSRIFGVDLISAATFGDLYRIVLTEADGTLTGFDVAAQAIVPSFFGAQSDVGFSRVSFFAVQDGVTHNFGIDNVAVESVPEPGSWLLLGVGLATRAAYRCRKRTIVVRV